MNLYFCVFFRMSFSNNRAIREVEYQASVVKVLYANLFDLEEQNKNNQENLMQLTNKFKRLQDCNFELEIEHFNSLQDLALFETQIYKYQQEIRQFEGTRMVSKSELKKLRQQKRCYEHVVDCFKQEMTVMSEQLAHLQEILNLSNKSCKEESCQLYNTVVDLQELNERLKRELIETEQKVLVENQLSLMKDAKIGELEQIIGQKNVDLNIHDEAIHEMKVQLENAIIEKHELQNNIISLNTTIMQLRVEVESNKLEKSKQEEKFNDVCKKNCESTLSVCQRNICDIKADLEKKSNKLWKIEKEFKMQKEMLIDAQRELEQTKEKHKEKCRNLKCINEKFKEKIDKYEKHNQQLKEELMKIKNKTSQLAQNECSREQELSQYKQVVIELRQTLIDINESISKSNLDHLIVDDDSMNSTMECKQKGDIYSACQCEINLYKKLIENFKKALIDSRQKANDSDQENSKLQREVKVAENKIVDLQKKIAKREKETCEHVKELVEKLEESKAEERRLTEFVDKLRQEIQKKIDEHTNIIKVQEESSAQEAQDEINSLKMEIKTMIQNQFSLNAENDKLLTQITRLQGIIGPMEESIRMFREKLEKSQSENQYLHETNKALILQKDKLTNELQMLQNAFMKLERANKILKESTRNMEMELSDLRNIKDDICVESRQVVNNVKAWLEEQRKINEQVKRKAQGYCEVIEKLKMENNNDFVRPPPSCPATCPPPKPNKRTPVTFVDEEYTHTWNLGSQGTGSLNDRDSPRGSPSSFMTCSVEEWYSPNYRDEETDEDGFIDRIEALTQKMKDKNRKWKQKCHECCKCEKK